VTVASAVADPWAGALADAVAVTGDQQPIRQHIVQFDDIVRE